MKNITIGITAHVDSGKTTLSEALLYSTGEIRRLGRVDHGSAWLDSNKIEKERGITVFAHQAAFTVGDKRFTLLDTPGHADFTAETERTMRVLDYAILVISASDGVQSHTVTLWKLLERYNIPVLIFVNKTDLPGVSREGIMLGLQNRLSPFCADFSDSESICENAAECSETLMEKFLGDKKITSDEIAAEVAGRRIFPCCFGSALKLDGIERLIDILKKYTAEPVRGDGFGAKVFKISTDSKGNRLTFMKLTGGSLSLRDEISYGSLREKVSGIRFYSGARFTPSDTAKAGEICAVTGLSSTYAGQGLGTETDSPAAFSEPVMSCKIVLPESKNAVEALAEMRILEEEDPQLHIGWDEQLREIYVRPMGEVQLEILASVVMERFGYEISFGKGNIAYKETIAGLVEGVGHYEPLRHYAEVHLILEPLERGSGLQFELRCSEDLLSRSWQRLILTHLEEKTHRGVLTGSPITDIKLIVASGKAHVKHTEGGDFRQATYRAVRQGLRSAESILLEPFYSFELEIPSECVGRAMTDIQQMCGECSPPELSGDTAILRGYAPVSEMNGYQSEIVAYTRGKGRLSLTVDGYRECHNADEVIAQIGYDCDGDTANTADSVFCSHGAGSIVRWDKVPERMHLPSCLTDREEFAEVLEDYVRMNRRPDTSASDEELMEIFRRTYGKPDCDPRKAFRRVREESTEKYKDVKLPVYSGPEYLLVDGYNIIFTWDELKILAKKSLDDARKQLSDVLSNYRGCRNCEVILVFDAYKVKGHHRDIEKYGGISIVYTRESETADSYIERVTHELSKKHRVRVATSDGPEQMIIFGNGARRVSASELRAEITHTEHEIREYLDKMN